MHARTVRRKATVFRLLLITALATLTALPALAQSKPFEPVVGQPGKDVVWVPTPQALVEKMLDMARLTPQDFHMDLGSGDGRTVITAAKRGARSMGIEYNPDMVELAKRNAEKEGVTARATFVKADLFETDFSKATVITLFLLPDINLRLRPKILDLKPGTRIASNTFTMGDWQPDQTATMENDCISWCTALFWIVPAKVQGTWKMPQGELALTQMYQMVSGTLKNGSNTTPIADGKLRGDQITFSAGGVQYTGKVNGNTIEGTTSGAATGAFRATR